MQNQHSKSSSVSCTEREALKKEIETLHDELAYYKKRHKTKSDHQVWQEGYHPELIESDGMLRQKMEYIHNNPVKRGLVAAPEHWLYSSARNYLVGDSSVIELDTLPV